jgi:hypothetical protein
VGLEFSGIEPKAISQMATPLFTDDDASDPAYVNIRAARNDTLKAGRFHCEYLWKFFESHADPEFRTELRSNFDARYWEMYLTLTLILGGTGRTRRAKRRSNRGFEAAARAACRNRSRSADNDP